MHLKFDENGYVCCILYGCMADSCIEYAGLVPTEPEAYTDMDDWAERAKTQAYYLNDQGNLTYDAEKAATLPSEDEIVPYTVDDLEALGFKKPIQQMIDKGAALAAWPPGSVFFEALGLNPQYRDEFEGSVWEQFDCGLSGVYAWVRNE